MSSGSVTPVSADPRPLAVPVLRAAVAALVMGVGLAVGTFVGGWVMGDGEGFPGVVVPAALVAIIVVVGVLLLRRFWDRRTVGGIGLTGALVGVRSLALGAGVVLFCAGATILVASLVGAVVWTDVDTPALLTFLVVNALVALLIEALPEELSIRGYALTALRSRYGRAMSAVAATAAFLAVPPVALTTQALLGRLAGTDPSDFAVAPPGQDPLVYYSMLTAFSVMLIFARESTVSASIWTCVGAHLAFLSVNRVLLGPADAGVTSAYTDTTLGVVFGVYLTAAIITFTLLRGRADARRDRSPLDG